MTVEKKLEKKKLLYESSKDWTIAFLATTIALYIGSFQIYCSILSYVLMVLGVATAIAMVCMLKRAVKRYNELIKYLGR